MMGTVYSLACRDCHCCIDVGKNGALWLQGLPETQQWLYDHQRHNIAYVSEYDVESDWPTTPSPLQVPQSVV